MHVREIHKYHHTPLGTEQRVRRSLADGRFRWGIAGGEARNRGWTATTSRGLHLDEAAPFCLGIIYPLRLSIGIARVESTRTPSEGLLDWLAGDFTSWLYSIADLRFVAMHQVDRQPMHDRCEVEVVTTELVRK
jgi:hypothetical protein